MLLKYLFMAVMQLEFRTTVNVKYKNAIKLIKINTEDLQARI